jgi:hypothetical protein
MAALFLMTVIVFWMGRDLSNEEFGHIIDHVATFFEPCPKGL